MTNWNKYGNPLEINSQQNINSFVEFFGTLPGGVDDDALWEINEEEGEINPISYQSERPENYIKGYLDIIRWLKKRHRNCESGYAFTYQNQEEPDDRSVGGFNSNNEGVTFVQIDGNGKVTQEFFKI